MAVYVLKLIEIPEEARNATVEASRKCGLPFDRVSFNSVLVGSKSPPVVIARSDDQAAVLAIQEKLEAAGSKLKLSEEGGSRGAVSAAAWRFGSLSAGSRYALMGGGALVLLAVGVGLNTVVHMAGDPPEAPPVTTSTVASAAQTSTAAMKVETPVTTPFTDLLMAKRPRIGLCGADQKQMACVIAQLTALAERVALEPEPEPEPDAGVSSDGGTDSAESSGDSGAPAEPVPISIDADPYLDALAIRVTRCAADERTRVKKKDMDGIRAGLQALMRPLTHRYGRDDCTESRTGMYECLTEERNASCKHTFARIAGAMIETEHRKEVLGWPTHLADAAGNKILKCYEVETGSVADPLDRAGIHIYRYELAAALGSMGERCDHDAFDLCVGSLSNTACARSGKWPLANATNAARAIIASCKALEGCR